MEFTVDIVLELQPQSPADPKLKFGMVVVVVWAYIEFILMILTKKINKDIVIIVLEYTLEYLQFIIFEMNFYYIWRK